MTVTVQSQGAMQHAHTCTLKLRYTAKLMATILVHTNYGLHRCE